jgi:uncharacterized protein YqgQ
MEAIVKDFEMFGDGLASLFDGEVLSQDEFVRAD